MNKPGKLKDVTKDWIRKTKKSLRCKHLTRCKRCLACKNCFPNCCKPPPKWSAKELLKIFKDSQFSSGHTLRFIKWLAKIKV